MPERQSVRLKIPSERLISLQQSMDGVKKKRKQRVNWKPGEKEAMVALREQYSTMPMKEFQQTYYPDRSVKNLGMIIKSLRGKEYGKEEEAETRSEDRHHSSTPRLHRLKRPRKSGPFVFSDSEDEDSSSDERIEDINASGLRTPNKFIKLSHSAEAQSPPARNAAEQRDPRLRSQTDETSAFSSKPQTTPPAATTVDEDNSSSESSSVSTGMSPTLLDLALDRPTECHGAEMQVSVIQDAPQQQNQLQTHKQEAFSETFTRQEFAKEVTNIYTKLQSLCRFEEQLFSVANQTRARNSVLEKECGIMKRDYDMMKKEMATMRNEKESWEVERASLKQENAHLSKRFGIMKDVFEGKFEA